MTLPDNATAYAEDFRNHQLSFQAHLNGRLPNVDPCPPSFFPPSSSWNSAEKDLFYHGLAIYSRLRPDLISQHIQTKSTFDVCSYLDFLETALQRLAEDSECTMTIDRREIEPAMEMSERWIQQEEVNAENLSATDQSNEPHSSPPTVVYQQQSCLGAQSISETSDAGKCHDLHHLDTTCLQVLETILREAEAEVHSVTDEMSTLDSPGAINTPRDFAISQGYTEQAALPEVSDDEIKSSSKSNFLSKIRKRLYMRRKRAEKSGRAFASHSSKLRPGRQRRPRKPPKPRAKTYETRQKVQLEERSRSPDEGLHESTQSNKADAIPHEPRSQGGMTRPYRVRKFFKDNEINAQALANKHLSLFHLSTLARLMRLYYSFHEPNICVEDASISADTISLLGDIATDFVCKIIRHVIITKEQEVRLKRELKVWKYDRDEVTAEEILESLKSMGLMRLSKELYFAKLMQETMRHPRSSQTTSFAEGQGTDSSNSKKQKTVDILLHKYSVPLVLPRSLKRYERDDIKGPKSDIFPQNIDEQELQRELDDEERLNAEDEDTSKAFEKSLWESCK